MSSSTIRVLGVDTSLRSSGVAVVEGRGSQLAAIEHDRIRNPSSRSVVESLGRIDDVIRSLLERSRPDAIAVEGIFYCKNVRTAVSLGEARGVVMAAGAHAGVPVFEYAPRRVKQAVVGNGAASKEQVRRMVMSILALTDEPQEDAGDALAIAICHLHNHTTHAALAPKQL